MSLLEELSSAAARAASAGVGVVRIGRAQGRGAGIVIGPGAVLTSAHNLRGEEVTVTFADGRSVRASVKGVDPDGDLAVLAADTGDVSPITWSESASADGPALGAAVFALALPPGARDVRVTFGLISGRGRSFRGPRGRLITDGIEHTAPLGRGSSGGPLVDTDGHLVAINTHRPGEGLYLALPATASLRSRVDALARGEAPTRRRLGVALAPGHVARRLRSAVGLEPRDGVLVREVLEGSPAASAGLRPGDLIVAAGGRPVDTVDSLLAVVDGVDDTGTINLSVLRGVEEIEVTVSFDVSG